MFANERHNKIIQMLQKNGAVTTSKLVEFFDVSIETIRRDLLCLEQQGKLLRVHGGAVTKGSMKPFLELDERNKEYNTQKKALSVKASEFIKNGDIIAVDSGSTSICFAQVLKERFSELTVITHSLDVFNILSGQDGFSLILTGGHYLEKENTFYGVLTLNTLDNLHIQKAFIFPSAVSLEHGICDYQKELYQIQKKLVSISDDIYILADSSKFEKNALLKLDDMSDKYSYITDSDLSVELRNLYKENNIKIYTN